MAEQNNKVSLQKLIGFDSAIQSVVMIGSDGKVLATERRPGSANLEPPGQSSVLYSRLAVAGGMASGSDSYFGRAFTTTLGH